MRYAAYGMGVSSSRPIPRLEGAPPAATADVRIELNARPAWFDETQTTVLRYASGYKDATGASVLVVTELANGWLRLLYTDGTDFFIDADGTEIWMDWPSTLTLDDVSSYLLGPVMGLVACLHGRTCLHASGAVIDGHAVALLGPPGAGKSTTAGAFGALGYGVLTDDVLVIDAGASGFVVYPGYPRLRLWPSSVTALAKLGAPALPTLPEDWGERRYHLNISHREYAFQTAPLPLGAVYLIGPRSPADSAPYVEPVAANETIMSLVSNTFAGRLLDRTMRAREFDVFSQVAATVPIRRVTPHADPLRIRQLCEVLVEDFRRLHTRDSNVVG